MKTVKLEVGTAKTELGVFDAIRENGKLFGLYTSKIEAEERLIKLQEEFKSMGYQVN